MVFSDESICVLTIIERRVCRRPGQILLSLLYATHALNKELCSGGLSFKANVWLPFLLQYPGLIFTQDNAKPHTARLALNCLTACQTLTWPARSLSNRACLRYNGKATASNKEY
ncbi:uncharacterized protein TNCV_3849341 [Trichonephila clavipes]|uniref:Transposase n=1 Tax=Trichonephila clavipes TaxID=2585209 RepID=A0A8X6V238_TRICX|nr:uncharacterized protein TNCV_3849341 [Trichonephila clavipes]